MAIDLVRVLLTECATNQHDSLQGHTERLGIMQLVQNASIVLHVLSRYLGWKLELELDILASDQIVYAIPEFLGEAEEWEWFRHARV